MWVPSPPASAKARALVRLPPTMFDMFYLLGQSRGRSLAPRTRSPEVCRPWQIENARRASAGRQKNRESAQKRKPRDREDLSGYKKSLQRVAQG